MFFVSVLCLFCVNLWTILSRMHGVEADGKNALHKLFVYLKVAVHGTKMTGIISQRRNCSSLSH